ncbi:hypothetical protein PIB30_050019 [Stylosanthes scabra]|uniref:Uncharacterized protein n=1 Tax=Stylosanthes scabra TaxID=79078 RepID=A0ABU6VFV7_9FABA|nr:hypothetical protein [Stylosanthes scabra]
MTLPEIDRAPHHGGADQKNESKLEASRDEYTSRTKLRSTDNSGDAEWQWAQRRARREAPDSELAPPPTQLHVNGDDRFRVQWGRRRWLLTAMEATETPDTVLGWGKEGGGGRLGFLCTKKWGRR